MSELVGLIIGLVLTISVYTYIWGDNPLYRIAVHILVGVTAAYAAIITVRQIILPAIQADNSFADTSTWLWGLLMLLAILLVIRFVTATLMAFRPLPSLPLLSLDNWPLAFLIGVGAAVALVGALNGTVWPQITAVDPNNPIQGLIVTLLTICVLLAFQFVRLRDQEDSPRLAIIPNTLRQIGRVVLTITFGALFAAVLNSSLIVLTDRVQYFVNGFLQ